MNRKFGAFKSMTNKKPFCWERKNTPPMRTVHIKWQPTDWYSHAVFDFVFTRTFTHTHTHILRTNFCGIIKINKWITISTLMVVYQNKLTGRIKMAPSNANVLEYLSNRFDHGHAYAVVCECSIVYVYEV